VGLAPTFKPASLAQPSLISVEWAVGLGGCIQKFSAWEEHFHWLLSPTGCILSP
jgi:hypothetical protein